MLLKLCQIKIMNENYITYLTSGEFKHDNFWRKSYLHMDLPHVILIGGVSSETEEGEK